MNIEELSKSQLLLLTLFVNFITSIAVGVLTASLLYQAPTEVTQTVNRIVDNTVQTVATGTPLATIIPTPQPAVKTIVQTEDTLLPPAIAGVEARTVQIYSSSGTSSPLIELGTYLPSARAIVTDTINGLPSQATIVFPDGSSYPASLSHMGATLTIYGFADDAKLPTPSKPSIVSHTNLKQGETIVSLTASGNAVTGIISKVDDDTSIETNLPTVPAGVQAVDLQGNLIGISTGSAGLYIPADKITALLTATSTAQGS